MKYKAYTRAVCSCSNESPVPTMEDNEEDIEMEDQEDGKRGITYQVRHLKILLVLHIRYFDTIRFSFIPRLHC